MVEPCRLWYFYLYNVVPVYSKIKKCRNLESSTAMVWPQTRCGLVDHDGFPQGPGPSGTGTMACGPITARLGSLQFVPMVQERWAFGSLGLGPKGP